MISLDIAARNFHHAQIKIDAIHQVYANSTCPEEKQDGDDESFKKLIDNMKLSLNLEVIF